jgi:DNA repair ATPase RecN
MRKLIVSIVILSVLYFIIGFIAMYFEYISKDVYYNLSAIIGSIASVCGLLTLGIVKKLNSDDFENVEMDYLKRASDAAKELNKKKEELASKAEELENSEKEIKKLEIKKQEMEFLVKKASLSLFLQEQIERNQKKVKEKIESDQELKEILSEIGPLKDKLNKLEQEIKSDPNVDLLEEIIFSGKRAVSNEKNEYKDIIELRPNLFGVGINMNQLVRTIVKIMAR